MRPDYHTLSRTKQKKALRKYGIGLGSHNYMHKLAMVPATRVFSFEEPGLPPINTFQNNEARKNMHYLCPFEVLIPGSPVTSCSPGYTTRGYYFTGHTQTEPGTRSLGEYACFFENEEDAKEFSKALLWENMKSDHSH